MGIDTKINVIICIAFILLGITCLLCVVIYGSWWAFPTSAGCFYFSYMTYVDDAYGVESIKAYLQRKKKSRKPKK